MSEEPEEVLASNTSLSIHASMPASRRESITVREPPVEPQPEETQDEEFEEFEESEEEKEDGADAILGSMIKPETQEVLDPTLVDLESRFNEEEMGQSESIFQDIQATLGLIPTLSPAEQEAAIGKIKGEYEKLGKVVSLAHRNEKTLLKKCKDLTNELTANASKVQAALKLSQNDRSTIASLRKEVKKAWKMVEAAAEKEARAKDVVASLKNEVEGLRGTMTEGAGPSMTGFANRNKLLELQIEQEDQLRRVTKEKQTIEQDLTTAIGESRGFKIEIEELNEKIKVFTTERALLDEEMMTLKDILAAKKSESDRQTRSREKVEQVLKSNMEVWDKKDNELKVRASETKTLREQMAKIEMQLQNERIRAEKLEKERDMITSRVNRLQQDYDDQTLNNQKLLNENHEQSRDLKSWEEELARLKENFKMISRVKETLTKKLKAVDEGKLSAETERDALRSTNHHITHDLEGIQREMEQVRKQLEMISRERDIAQKNFVKSTGAAQKQFNILKLSEQTQRNLEQEIMGYKDEATKMRKLIYTLEKERDIKTNEASRLDQVIQLRDEDSKMKDMVVFDSKKKIIELERKLKEQQALYENVRADRNVYSKNLIESQDEITEMKRKLKIMNHQVEQLKEEIATKESVLVKEHFEHAKLDKEKETLSVQISRLQTQFEEAQQMIQNQQAEENKLRHIIMEADQERLKQKKEYDAVVQERDILGTQLIRRNDELSLLYEKIKIQTSTLNKGEIQYRERLEDIRVLRLEIKRLRREKAILQTETQHVDSLRNEIFRLQRDVLRERTRVKVLEEELESPMNIHRWRKLAGSDPSTFELITKIQTLQKRLIAKTEEVVEKELIIQQKEKLYKEVKEVLQRQPGPEVVEELRVVREAVRTKIRESKALASELNMYHSQVNEYKFEIERLSRELQDLKKKYYQLRKKAQSDRRIAADTIQDRMYPSDIYDSPSTIPRNFDMRQSIKAHPPTGPKFSGGGFNMSSGTQLVHIVQEINKVSSKMTDISNSVPADSQYTSKAPSTLPPREEGYTVVVPGTEMDVAPAVEKAIRVSLPSLPNEISQ